jgi:FkbM family methyltransferase
MQMQVLRQAAAAVTDLACLAVGRKTIVRSARFIYRRACLDVPNDMKTNGELDLQRNILVSSPPGHAIRVFDVGANVGQWSAAFLTEAQRLGRLQDLDLHAFEPSSYTFARLSESLRGFPTSLVRAALCERPGYATLHVATPGAGRNSLHAPLAASAGIATEQVHTTTVDLYAAGLGIDQIALVKIDTEGHDLAVLRGAYEMLAEQRIAVTQFEYNSRWVEARSFLRDAFEFLLPMGYRVGKLTPRGVEFYTQWAADLETFVEGNYVACTPEASRKLPTIAWRKSVGSAPGYTTAGPCIAKSAHQDSVH